MAKRLHPDDDVTTKEVLEVSTLQPLVDLVAAFPLRYDEPVASVAFEVLEAVSVDQVVQWAKRVCSFVGRWVQSRLTLMGAVARRTSPGLRSLPPRPLNTGPFRSMHHDTSW